MWTMALQWVFALLAVACALLVHRVGALVGTGGTAEWAWRVVGRTFTIFCLNMVVMLAWGTAAMAAGPASGVMRAYLRWAPALNHSRTFLWATCFLLLGCALLPGAATLRRWRPAPLLLAGLGAGALAGAVEGALVPGRHFGRVALWDAGELGITLVVLSAYLLLGAMDRHLWMLLTVFAIQVALGVLWLAAMSVDQDGGAWGPSPRVMAAVRAGFGIAMVGIAWHRLRLARRGERVGPLTGLD